MKRKVRNNLEIEGCYGRTPGGNAMADCRTPAIWDMESPKDGKFWGRTIGAADFGYLGNPHNNYMRIRYLSHKKSHVKSIMNLGSGFPPLNR